MNEDNQSKLAGRVTRAAEAALAEQHYVSPLDVLLGIGWVDGNTFRRWRQGQIECLEQVIQTRPARLAEAMDLFQSWAAAQALTPRETPYVAATSARQALRFSRSGDPDIERRYRTHWVSPTLSEKKQKRLAEKTDRAPDLVVVQPLNREWKCHRCGGSGDLLVMENPGPACLRCVGLGDLEFLPAGDMLLTRRAKAKSTRHAVVVRFSRTRRRYERQGLLLEPDAIAQAKQEIGGRGS